MTAAQGQNGIVEGMVRKEQHVEHGFGPVWDGESRVLMLGSMPSPKSRAMRFYYGHPLNRFWMVMAAVFDDGSCLAPSQAARLVRDDMSLPANAPDSADAMSDDETLVAARRDFALRHHIALWDALASCDITGASDTSIRNAVPNDLTPLVAGSHITRIFATGTKAFQLYRRLCEPALRSEGLQVASTCLPSTSPANAAMRLPALIDAYRPVAEMAEGDKEV